MQPRVHGFSGTFRFLAYVGSDAQSQQSVQLTNTTDFALAITLKTSVSGSRCSLPIITSHVPNGFSAGVNDGRIR